MLTGIFQYFTNIVLGVIAAGSSGFIVTEVGVLVDCLVGLALLGGLLACLVVDGLGRSLVDRRLLQLTINLELVRTRGI